MLDRVSHHYGSGSGGLPTFADIRPGEKVGLVGRSGAGKSTLVNLILRFFDTEGGAIRIDGQDVRRVTQDSLRRQIGMVTQDRRCCTARSGRTSSTAAPRRARPRWSRRPGARRRTTSSSVSRTERPRGYDAHVGERGVKLSGGQRQRIALARVILKDAPILVLDEATSALD